MAAVSRGMGMDRLWGMPDWARLQHPLMLVRARMVAGQAGLGFCSSWST